MIDRDAYIAGYMHKEGGWADLFKVPAGAAMWTGDALIKMTALMALVPPAIGAAAGMTASNLTAPSKLDEESLNALIEEQETDRLLAETARLQEVHSKKDMRDKEMAKNERSLHL